MTVRPSEIGYETPTRGDSLAEQVYRQLSSAILAGSFAPLERISIRRLAEEIGVSVTPVREAVLRFVSDDVLQATERNAIIVPTRDEDDIREIFEIRRGLEGTLAARSATRLGDADVTYLTETQAAFLQSIAVQDFKEVLRYNSLFHFRIYRKAELPVHLKIVENLWLRIGPTLRYMYPTLLIDRERRRRHEDIIECARLRDAERLRVAILADLETSEQALQQHLSHVSSQPKRSRVVVPQ